MGYGDGMVWLHGMWRVGSVAYRPFKSFKAAVIPHSNLIDISLSLCETFRKVVHYTTSIHFAVPRLDA